MSGAFIAFEGGEGAGKSTQLAALAASLGVAGHRVVVTHEPGGTAVGRRIRSLLLEPGSAVCARAEALLYAADRAQHVETVIRPALAAGAVVITDRYVDSSLAYQGAGRALAAEDVRRLSAWASGGLCPDLTVLLDIDPRIGLGRAAGRRELDRIEQESVAFHEVVRSAFLQLAAAEPVRYLVLDASLDRAALTRRVGERVAALLAGRT